MPFRKAFIIAAITLISLGLVTSCTQNNSNQKGEVTLTAQEKKVIRKEEDKIALYLINHYEDVRKIEFEHLSKGGFGTTDSLRIRINDDSIVHIVTGSSDGKYSVSYNSEEFNLKKKQNDSNLVTTDGVEIVYYEEK